MIKQIKDHYTPKALAEQCDLSVRDIYYHIHRGNIDAYEIPSVKGYKSFLIPESEAKAFIKYHNNKKYETQAYKRA